MDKHKKCLKPPPSFFFFFGGGGGNDSLKIHQTTKPWFGKNNLNLEALRKNPKSAPSRYLVPWETPTTHGKMKVINYNLVITPKNEGNVGSYGEKVL